MAFTSFSFGLFLLLAFIIYYSVPPKTQWIVLLCLNIIFYGSYIPYHLSILIVITLITYIGAIKLEKAHSQQFKKIWFGAIIICCVSILIFFKYFNFLSTSLCAIFSFSTNRQTNPLLINIILPVGISFYTFQTLGYLIDVYRGNSPAEHHLGIYAVFVSFFPQIISGPIARSNQLLPQYHCGHTFQYKDVTYGLKLMAWGFFKKMAIADSYALYVDTIFNSAERYQGLSLLLASILFSIQIYCDFSGYSDIAIGVAYLFGIHLPQNFRSPYFSTSIKEFWSRWHISLSQWLRDYIYIPLGGNRKGTYHTHRNLLITFFISGLWHGANWTYILWGILHGLGQIIENTLCSLHTAQKFLSSIPKTIKRLLAFAFCTFLWILFRSNSLTDALYIIEHIATGITMPITYLKTAYTDLSLSWISIFYLVLPLIPLFLFDYFSLHFDVIDKISSLSVFKRWSIYIGFTLFTIFMMPSASGHSFIYFKF